MAGHTTEDLGRHFRFFADMCRRESAPLYAALSHGCSEDPLVLEMAGHGSPKQPPVNLVFAAVHFLLLGGIDHPLARFYRSLGGDGDPARAWPHFVDFCGMHGERLVELIASRRVQTNEVGRCGLLLPAFALVHARFERPLHVIDLGASAGLNLQFDRYRYEYDDGRSCGEEAPVVIRTALRGTAPPAGAIPASPPPVAGRVGIDIAPVTVTDDDSVRWIQALVWPDHDDRFDLQRAAIALARRDPARVVQAEGRAHLPDTLAAVAPEHVPCIYHSHATYQMGKTWRSDFDDDLDRVGRTRDLAHVALEWLGDDPGPCLHVTWWDRGTRRRRHLADCHHHGRWLSWVDA